MNTQPRMEDLAGPVQTLSFRFPIEMDLCFTQATFQNTADKQPDAFLEIDAGQQL